MASPLRTSDAICVDEKRSPYGATRSTVEGTPLSPDELRGTMLTGAPASIFAWGCST